MGFPLLSPGLGQVWGLRYLLYLDGSPRLLLTVHEGAQGDGTHTLLLEVGPWKSRPKEADFHQELGAQVSVFVTSLPEAVLSTAPLPRQGTNPLGQWLHLTTGFLIWRLKVAPQSQGN